LQPATKVDAVEATERIADELGPNRVPAAVERNAKVSKEAFTRM
jgi:hypothetical protein